MGEGAARTGGNGAGEGRGGGADGDFSGIKVFLDVPEEGTKRGSGGQAEFFQSPPAITELMVPPR